jgi:threonine/homoserine/homoserine lactone efflux protein
MTSMWSYFVLGLSMGLSAGLSPGPLLALVITATLRSGLVGGLQVALAPFVTDAPIIVLSVVLVGFLPPEALRWVGTVGGLVVIWMGVDIIRSATRAELPSSPDVQVGSKRELWRGAVVNALNPHPYLFWATVGGPALVSGWKTSPWYALAFLLPFYALLVGSKMMVAWLVSSRSEGLSAIWYRRLLAGCGVLLLFMGGWLIWQSWTG